MPPVEINDEIKKSESWLNLSAPSHITYIDDNKSIKNEPENNITMIENRGSEIINQKKGEAYYIYLICAIHPSLFCSVISIVKAAMKCKNVNIYLITIERGE